MNHLEVYHLETTVSDSESDWLEWIAKAEFIAGHHLDGDQETDGFSLDFAFEAFEAGQTPRQFLVANNVTID